MSDDELPPAGGMGGMGMDDDMSDDDMDNNAPADLPEGIKKEIIKEAPGANWKKPKAGDEVTVHYVGTLEADGSEFDSSRGRDSPFEFSLGKGQVIKGWDLGVATMKLGEVSKFTLAPDFGYGADGSPPKIPPSATLVFEVELLSWVSKDDLFQDGGVIKEQSKEGSGWKEPKDGDEVQLSLKASAKDGAVIEERLGLEYVIGSEALGPLRTAVDKALKGMKKGEEATLKCTKDYAYGDKHPDGATLELKLEQLYETKDISPEKNKTIMKKQVSEGEDYDTPKDASKVTLSVVSVTDGAGATIPGFEAKTLEFVAGNGEVCDLLEYSVAAMKKSERALVTCTNPALCCEERLGLQGGAPEKVCLTLVLTDFEKAKDTWSMSEDEKIEFGNARKVVGSELFKRGRIAMALDRYKKVIDLFSYIDNFKEEKNKKSAKDLKKVCELNRAACQLKIQDFAEAKKSCDTVLKDECDNLKALFRRAQANVGLKNYPDSIRDVKRVIDLEPQNREARAVLKSAMAGQKEDDKQSKNMFSKMCQGLGKGKIPEPYKAPKGKGGEYDSEDEDGEDDEPPPTSEPPVAEAAAAEAAAVEPVAGA